jgi:hypothetical protein
MLEDQSYTARWDTLFAAGNLHLTMPDGKPRIIYGSQRP